ncbi:MAG: amidohydrolase family protein [Opitutaceae bacterium]
MHSLNGPGFRAFLKKRLLDEWGDNWIISWLFEKLLEEIPHKGDLRKELLEQISLSDSIKGGLKDLNDKYGADASVSLALDGNLDFVTELVSDSVFDKVMDLLSKDDADKDARTKNLYDLIRFVLRGLSPSIDALTKEFIAELHDDDAFVALMMDICEEDETDNALFEQQIKDTSAQIYKYPGRILPFVKANPNRRDVVEIVLNALKEKGCVGVKLYPSLGYRIDDPKLMEIYKFCSDNGYPVLLHCNMSGFIKSEDDVANCRPSLWRPILENPDYSNLRLCFGHFGDEKNLVTTNILGYTAEILDLMREPSYGGRVYADISYHVKQLEGSAQEIQYFHNMKLLLDDPDIGSQILFGSDSFLVQQQMAESSYWTYFERRFSDEEFVEITSANPIRFLGLPDQGGEIDVNMRNYIAFLKSNVAHVSGKPASWLASYLDLTDPDLILQIRDLGDGWSESIRLQSVVYTFMKKARYLSQSTSFDEARDVLMRRRLFDHGDSDEFKRGRARKFVKKLKRELVDQGVVRNDAPGFDVKIVDYLLKETATVKQFTYELDKYYDA